jgi:hypothetical protein
MAKPCLGNVYVINGKSWCVGEKKSTKNKRSKFYVKSSKKTQKNKQKRKQK